MRSAHSRAVAFNNTAYDSAEIFTCDYGISARMPDITVNKRYKLHNRYKASSFTLISKCLLLNVIITYEVSKNTVM